ncbi:hypothetical protein HPB52_024942 [Rhipicephalus sanguineus]|uniref:Uncharacterized protein n=2 Tax=Rhipicephalus sanguineus TaxID=34632 RepID=A0A9D4SMC8_RHISA|nr:hypothetical protein HPB52_025619 [Rhipicephalus sanguineus]KAH7932043.1 hypothetical protein HPB52_024942 [Rhipicephalus sanguineus]
MKLQARMDDLHQRVFNEIERLKGIMKKNAESPAHLPTLSGWHPGVINPRCCLFGGVDSLNRILWGCPDDPPPADLICSSPTEEQWEALLSSNDRDIQTRVLGRAEDVIEKHSLAAYVA